MGPKRTERGSSDVGDLAASGPVEADVGRTSWDTPKELETYALIGAAIARLR